MLEDVLDHAIGTVPVVSLLVEADHHRHHSSELEEVEVLLMEVADAIAHAMYFWLSLSLFLTSR